MDTSVIYVSEPIGTNLTAREIAIPQNPASVVVWCLPASRRDLCSSEAVKLQTVSMCDHSECQKEASYLVRCEKSKLPACPCAWEALGADFGHEMASGPPSRPLVIIWQNSLKLISPLPSMSTAVARWKNSRSVKCRPTCCSCRRQQRKEKSVLYTTELVHDRCSCSTPWRNSMYERFPLWSSSKAAYASFKRGANARSLLNTVARNSSVCEVSKSNNTVNHGAIN